MILVDPRYVVPVSVTGDWCALRCKHCNAVYLEHMVRVDDMKAFAERGRKTFLISGGMTKEGVIPFKSRVEILRDLKREYNLRYNFHIGFPKTPPECVDDLADVISADFFSSSDVLREVYGIDRRPEEILSVLLSFSKPVVPHITVGIMCGELSHEFESLRILSKHFDRVVLNVFIPTPRTAFERCPPPSIEDVRRVFEEARRVFKPCFWGVCNLRVGTG